MGHMKALLYIAELYDLEDGCKGKGDSELSVK